MELQQLRYFLAVARLEHFSRAADELHVSQPHLSRLMRAFERELGVELFRRTTRSVALTPAGRVLRDRLARALDDIEAACAEARAVHAGLRGRIRLGFVGSVTYSWLPLLVRSFREAYPDVEVEIHSEMLTGPQVSALREGSLDVGIMRTPGDPSLHNVLLAHEQLVVALPAGHPYAGTEPLDPAVLANDRFINYANRSGSTTRRVVLEACLQAGFAPQTELAVDDTHTLVSLVAAGIGVALVPASTTRFAVDGVCYRSLPDRYPHLDLVACWTEESESSPLVTNFAELCRNVREPAAALPGCERSGSDAST